MVSLFEVVISRSLSSADCQAAFIPIPIAIEGTQRHLKRFASPCLCVPASFSERSSICFTVGSTRFQKISRYPHTLPW